MSSSDEDFILAAYYWGKTKKKKHKFKVDYNEESYDIPLQRAFDDIDLRVINEAEITDEAEVTDEAAVEYEKRLVELPPQFQLDSDDSYDDCCGKVFITKSRFLVLHCSLCDSKYGTVLHFLKHLTMHHYSQEELKMVEKNWTKDSVYSNDYLQEQNFESPNEIDIKPELHIAELKDESESNDAEEDTGWNSPQTVKQQNKRVSDSSVLDPFHPFFKNKYKGKPDTFKCNQCEKHFRTKSGLGYHIQRHSEIRKYKCTICGIAFKERSNCNAHIKRHTGEKKYDCRQCGKQFFTRNENERHQRTHTGERPYICSTCGRDFAGTSELKRHMMRHDNIRPHKCTFCEKKFFSGSSLRNHIRVHTNERPFACIICSASFKRRYTLKQHNKLHINARSYACNICDKSFNQKPAQLSHMKIHHKIL